MVDLEDAIRVVSAELPGAIVREGDKGQRVCVHWPGQTEKPFKSKSLMHASEDELRAWARSLPAPPAAPTSS